MRDDIKVNISMEGADVFLRDLKIIQSELEKTIELRNRALRPRWRTRLKDFFLGRTMTIYDKYGTTKVIATTESGLKDWLSRMRPNLPHK